jgi:hypothetical protein
MKLSKEYNLALLYPDIAKEWHPTKNGDLIPEKITPGSNKKLWWQCKKGHEWLAIINYRKNGDGCPYCSNKKVGYGNDLQSKFPEIAKEWHPTKNGDLKPSDIVFGTSKKAWFKCREGHEWEAIVVNRTASKRGCPYCSGRFVGHGNDLQSKFPEIAKEWHPTKNEDLNPSQVHHGSFKKIWWKCMHNHEWETNVSHRTRPPGTNCPFCSHQTSKPELYLYAELQLIFSNVYHRKKIKGLEVDIFIEDINLGIEYDGVFFHQKRVKKDKIKKDKIKNLGIDLINLREKPLKRIYKSDIIINSTQDLHKTFLSVLSKIKSSKNLSEKKSKAIDRYLLDDKPQNEIFYKKLVSYLPGPLPEQSIQGVDPQLVQEWHPTKNGAFTPRNISANSMEKIWWVCKKGHEYQSRPNHRNQRNSGCPYCKNKKVGYGNDLQSKFPEIAKEWHPTKNGDLKPSDIVPGYAKHVWWVCKKGHSWEHSPYRRGNCPYCLNKKIGYGNDLQSKFPEIAKEWHPTKNGDLKPSNVFPRSIRKVWWKCKEGHEWETAIGPRTYRKSNCGECYKKRGIKCP